MPGDRVTIAPVDQTHPSLTQFLAEFKRVAPAIVDSYFIVDTERRIVDFNRAFYAMLPRQVARGPARVPGRWPPRYLPPRTRSAHPK